MRCGYDWHGLLAHVVAKFFTSGVYIGEVANNEIFRFVANIEINAIQTQPFHFVVDSACYYVAWG